MGFGSFLRKAAGVALPVAGAMFGGPVGGALGGALGGAVSGGGLRGALMGGALGGAGGYLAGGGLSRLGGGALGGGTLTGGAIPTGTQAFSFGAPAGVSAGGQAATMMGAAGGAPLTIGAGSMMPGGTFASQSGGGNMLNQILSGADRAAPSMGGYGNIASNLYSGIQGTQSYKDMARAQQAANQRSLSAVSPFMAGGQAANTRLQALLGLGGEDSEEVLSSLRESPGYQFRLGQGQEALDRSLAARGGLMSGRALKATQELGQGLADQTYNDYLRNLAGQSAQGLQAAGGMAGLYGAGGDIEANRIAGQSNLQNKSLAGIMGGY